MHQMVIPWYFDISMDLNDYHIFYMLPHGTSKNTIVGFPKTWYYRGNCPKNIPKTINHGITVHAKENMVLL